MQSSRQQIGPYRTINLIGRGGVGEVYLAEDPRIQRQFAIKVIQTGTVAYSSATAVNRAILLQREVRAIAQLKHPGIVRVYSYDEETSNGVTSPYIVMEYYREGSFAGWLQQRSEPPSLPDVAHFISQAAEALQYAHTNGIVHQDVKPSNFLIRTNKDQPNRPDLLLTDFAVAPNTLSTTPMANITYMAPEQLQGNTQPLPATDQYALATMAYELLTSRPPFQGPPTVVLRQHLNEQPQPPSMLNLRLAQAVDNVILHALAKRPEDRYSSISEFARAFQQAVQRQSGSVQPPVPGQRESNPPLAADQGGADIRETLRISPAEAYNGTSRTLMLPGGREVTLSVPANAYNGQVIRLKGQGEPSRAGGPAGNLLVTISITAPQAPPPPPGPAKVSAPQPQSAYPSANTPQSLPPASPSGKGMETRFYQSQGIDIERITTELEQMFLVQGYQVQHFGNSDAMTVQLKKGGDFALLVGMQTALTVTMQQSPGGMLAMIGQQRWADKAAVGAVGMLVLWPLAFTAGAGAIRQANLSSQVLNALDALVRRQQANAQVGPVPSHLMQQLQQPGAPTPYPPPQQEQRAPPPPSPSDPRQWGAVPTQQEDPAAAPLKVTCPNCQMPNDAGDSYCQQCGQALTAQTAQKTLCPKCGAELKPQAAFCTRCGASFSQPEERTAVVEVTPATQRVSPGTAAALGYLLFADGTRIELVGERVTVGRYLPNSGGLSPDINLHGKPESHTVSRIHASFACTGSACTLTDLNSTNATFINGQRLEPDRAMPINDGDALQFGKVTCTFKLSPAAK